ncbi:hypothetical protein Sango_2792600 [Sesamum angolense]|uniref:DUF4283 domain-containing protein n=1 Tax=Sesamum angolense TaxID=2727404 RepID=A0AAE1T7D4_9LAMI|nr:hypothetical protein Sango_2792600 [Sesamum angolense]
MEEVIEGGPWLYLRQPIVLQKWEPGMVLRKLKHTEIPIWIKLRHLPVELWTTEGLSTIASGIGRPLYPDAITRACTRLDFTRVCVMLNVSSSLGHSTKECPLSKSTKPAVSIYVRKSMPLTPAASELKLSEQVQTAPISEEIPPKTEVDSSQFVHCRVLVHELYETFLITVVYGVNDVSARRELWQGLIDLAMTVWQRAVAGGRLAFFLFLCKGNVSLGITAVWMPEPLEETGSIAC